MSSTEESNYLLEVWLPSSIDWVQRLAGNVIDAISTFASSTTIIVMWSTFVAAFAGAYGAQFIAEKIGKRKFC